MGFALHEVDEVFVLQVVGVPEHVGLPAVDQVQLMLSLQAVDDA